MTEKQQAAIQDVEEEEGTVDQEFCRLRRQLRIVDGERRSYAEDIGRCIRKQKHEIELLLKEHEIIATGLEVVFSKRNRIKDEASADKIRELIHAMDYINKQASWTSEKIVELDKKINTKIHEIRVTEKEHGVKPGPELLKILSKRMRILENTQHSAMMKFNTQLTANVKLRQELDHYRQDKAKFDSIYLQLLTKLKTISKKHAQLIKEASDTYVLRDEVKNKQRLMEMKEESEIAEHAIEMQELQRVIGQRSKLYYFMNVKLNDRADYKEEEEKKKLKTKTFFVDSETDKNRIGRYELAFNELRQVTGKDDIHSITTFCMNKETENFALFKYVSELEDDELKVKEDIENVRKEAANIEKTDIDTEAERHEWLRELEEEGNEAGRAADEAEKTITEISRSLHEIIAQVSSIFKTLGCDESKITNMLGQKDGATEKTVMFYMGLIEQKIAELIFSLNLQAMLKMEPVTTRRNSLYFDMSEPVKLNKIEITPPDIKTDEFLGEADICPLTLEELRAVVMKKIHMSGDDTGSTARKNSNTNI